MKLILAPPELKQLVQTKYEEEHFGFVDNSRRFSINCILVIIGESSNNFKQKRTLGVVKQEKSEWYLAAFRFKNAIAVSL